MNSAAVTAHRSRTASVMQPITVGSTSVLFIRPASSGGELIFCATHHLKTQAALAVPAVLVWRGLVAAAVVVVVAAAMQASELAHGSISHRPARVAAASRSVRLAERIVLAVTSASMVIAVCHSRS